MKKNIKVSIIIPYKQRLDNIRLSFESMANQTMNKDEFEVVVGVMEYCDQYVQTCRQFLGKLNIRSIMVCEDWEITYARNIAMKQAVGEVIVNLDVDMVLPPHFLTNLYEKHYAFQQNQCVLGQMIDYDNNNTDVESVTIKPYAYYEKKIADLQAAKKIKEDIRCQVEHCIPWAFAWTALAALPRKTIEEHQLYFNQNFHGYGVEDLEWAYRITQTGTPILLKQDVWAIHLPHVRSVKKNRRTESANYRYFLNQYPDNAVELACAFGDFEANNLYKEFKQAIITAADHQKAQFTVLTGKIDHNTTLVVGAWKDEHGHYGNQNDLPQFDSMAEIKSLPIVGLAFPFPDNSFANCIILPAIKRLSEKFLAKILTQCQRVAEKVSFE